MTAKNFLLSRLDTYHKVQCSNDKSDNYTFKSLEEALNYKFVRFGNQWFIPSISIDIDHKDINIQNIIEINNLPTPTFIVNTDKGIHLHFFLEVPVNTAIHSQLKQLRKTIYYLQSLFNGDKFATTGSAGRIWRSPLQHTHTFSGKLVSFSDFKLPIGPVKLESVQSVGKSKYKKILATDFKEIEAGTRNSTLFSYGSAYAYTTGVVDVYEELSNKNMLMPLPLSESEVVAISNSIKVFMETKYRKGIFTSSKRTIEFNQKVAKKQSDKKFNELIQKSCNLLIPFYTIPKLTARKASVLFKISKDTWTKYRKSLIFSLKEYILVKNKPHFAILNWALFDNILSPLTFTLPYKVYPNSS